MMSEWIPTTERLPDKPDEYIVTEQNFGGNKDSPTHAVYVHLVGFDPYIGVWEEGQRYFVPDVSNITAWMPVPKPYRSTK